MRYFAIEEAPSPLPALYATLVMNVLAFYSESDRTQARLWTGLSLHCQRKPASAWEGSWTKTGSVNNQIIPSILMLQSNKPYLKWTRIEGKSYKVKNYEGPDIHLSSALENKIYCDVHVSWRQYKSILQLHFWIIFIRGIFISQLMTLNEENLYTHLTL